MNMDELARILVVDDEDEVREVLALMLESAGFQVVTAEGGQRALEVYRQEGDTIGLVILDQLMPDLRGTDVFDAIREHDPGARVLFLTGFDGSGMVRQAAEHRQFRGVLLKPVPFAKLVEEVRGALADRPLSHSCA